MKSPNLATALNAICPYYTMFPIEFPLRVLGGRAKRGHWVADPFCGRGTTNFAARLLGLPSIGIDSSPVAVALTKAKMARARIGDIVRVAKAILDATPNHLSVPEGDFWDLAYDRTVLRKLCWLRRELIRDCTSDARIILRAIVLGALHGPKTKTVREKLPILDEKLAFEDLAAQIAVCHDNSVSAIVKLGHQLEQYRPFGQLAIDLHPAWRHWVNRAIALRRARNHGAQFP